MIPKKYLLLLAGLVWGAAGFNILRLGLLAYVGLVKPLYLLLSAAVFVIFQKMVFGKLVQKHTARILAYEAPKVCFWHFFDRKSFLIMAFMMTMGISLRKFSLVPIDFIAFFYTGLGASLLLAGILFLRQFFLTLTDNTKEVFHMDFHKLISSAFRYAIAGLACGVFYREFTKFTVFTGKTTLAFTHLHLLVMGTLLFLILAAIALHTDLAEQARFQQFRKVYAVALPFMVIMFFVRGILQALQTPLSTGANAAISGIAGISHILMTVSLVLLFLALRRCTPKKA